MNNMLAVTNESLAYLITVGFIAVMLGIMGLSLMIEKWRK